MHHSAGCDVRALDESEVDEVTGGVVAVAGYLGLCALVGLSWDLPIGATTQQAAAKLGMSHLL
jgi:hypothetical protein